MPPRHVYWTIIYGNQATSFRAATPEELLPTLKQLQSRHPDATLKYFARGRLWNSQEEARPRREERPWQTRPREERPRTDKPRDERPWQTRPRDERPRSDKPRDERPRSTRPGDERPRSDRPRDARPSQEKWRDARRPDGTRRDRPPERQDQRGGTGERQTDRAHPGGERRGKGWRPGGQHRDPRDRWKVPRDVKRKRFAQQLRRDRMSPRPPKKKDGDE